MPPFSNQSALPLPSGWRKVTRAGVLHAISVAARALTALAVETRAVLACAEAGRSGRGPEALGPRPLFSDRSASSEGWHVQWESVPRRKESETS